MPVALVDFEAIYDGQLVSFAAGEVFADNHEIPRKHPDKFSLSSSRRGKRRRDSVGASPRSQATPLARRRAEVPAAPAREPDRLNRVILRTSPSDLTVTVGLGALKTMRDETYARSDAIEDEHIETGWGLTGTVIRSWDRDAFVSVAIPLGGSSRRDVDGVLVDQSHFSEVERQMVAVHETEHRYIGSAHVHPHGSGEPSSRDLETWLGELEHLDGERGATRYLGVILTAGKYGWRSNPRLHAYIVRQDERGRAICEPVTVKASA
jgi:hypothetical protein